MILILPLILSLLCCVNWIFNVFLYMIGNLFPVTGRFLLNPMSVILILFFALKVLFWNLVRIDMKRIIIEIDYEIGDVVFDSAGNRFSIHSIRADFVMQNHCDVYYYCRNIDVDSTEYNAYAWFRKESLTKINSKSIANPELPF